MGNEKLFGWLMKYQIRHNLNACLEEIPHWKGSLRKRHATQETPSYDYTGFLLFANGDTLVDELREQHVIQDSKKPTFIPAGTMEKFFEYFDEFNGADGAFVYDGKHGSLARINELTNALPSPDYSSVLPRNFVDDSQRYIPTEDNIGTKTKVALKVSQAYPENVDVFQIKKTIYNSLGMGTVTHYKAGYLREMFYLTEAPENYTGQFIDQENKIVGVYLSYRMDNGKLVEDSRMYVGLAGDGSLRFQSDSRIAPESNPTAIGLETVVELNQLPAEQDSQLRQRTSAYHSPQPAGCGADLPNGYRSSVGGEGTLDNLLDNGVIQHAG